MAFPASQVKYAVIGGDGGASSPVVGGDGAAAIGQIPGSSVVGVGSGGGYQQQGNVVGASPTTIDYDYGNLMTDPLENVSVSTIAVVLLFGTITFATVGMAARTWLLGDNRALVAATSLKVKSSAPPEHESSSPSSANRQHHAKNRNNNENTPKAGHRSQQQQRDANDQQSQRSGKTTRQDSMLGRSIGGSLMAGASTVHSGINDSMWGATATIYESHYGDEGDRYGGMNHQNRNEGAASKGGWGDYGGGGEGGGDGGNNSVASPQRSIGGSVATNVTRIISSGVTVRPWEPSFVSTYVLFHNLMLFGWVLLGVYLLDNHPPFGGTTSSEGGLRASSHSLYGGKQQRGTTIMDEERGAISEFDEDQFVFWIIALVVYGYFTSWRRNDGRSDDSSQRTALFTRTSAAAEMMPRSKSRNITSGLRDDTSETSRSTRGSASRYRKRGGQGFAGIGAVAAASRSLASAGSGSTSSDLSKKLEDIILDDDSRDNDILSKLESDTKHDGEDADTWYERGAQVFGFANDAESIGLQSVKKEGVAKEARPEEDVLNRFQTLEWKGFMSMALLFYRYNHADSYHSGTGIGAGGYQLGDETDADGGGALSPEDMGTNIYYNLARVGTTSYLFLTGYHHTSYFYHHPANARHATSPAAPSNRSIRSQDSEGAALPRHYGMWRVFDVLFRINWTAVFLSSALGNSPLEYAACLLHTFFFLVIWFTMRWNRSVNYEMYWFRLKILVLACVIFVFWDCNLLVLFLSGLTVEGANKSLWEWCEQSHSYHWAAFLGMVFAVNHPVASLQLRKLESLRKLETFLSKGTIALGLAAAAAAWAAGPLRTSELSYDVTHPYFGFVPIFAYIYWRNITPSLRKRHVGLLRWVGEYSLEIYLLHHHVFMNQSILVVLPGFPRCNFCIVTTLVLVVARFLHKLTVIFRLMLLPENDENTCIHHASIVGGSMLASYGVALGLSWANMVTVGTIVTIVIICGSLLYQTVMDVTWQEYRSAGLRIAKKRYKSSDSVISAKREMDESTAAKISPPLIGTLSIFLIGMAWHGWALSAGASPDELLNTSCSAFVNEGLWAPVKVCSAFERGRLHREYNVMSHFGSNWCPEATTAIQWAWPSNSPSMRCGFRYRSHAEIQRKLRGRKIVMLGDSTVLSLFNALGRFMGDYESGGYSGLVPSHSDSTKKFGSTTFEYKWAPLAVDAVTKLKNVRTAASSNQKSPPDVVIASVGAMDRLHVSVSDEDQQSHTETVKKLARELSKLREMGVSTIWFTPTTINTRALNSEEKRSQMSESTVQDMRRLYAELGVESSASFVLDGPSFTRGRVRDSYDGIHYPRDVYDAGIQILFNSLDWLLHDKRVEVEDFHPLQPGSTSNPYLGLMMLCFSLIGLFFFDGYFGVSLLAQLFVRRVAVSPGDLYWEAMSPVFARLKLPTPSNNTPVVEEAVPESEVDDNKIMNLIKTPRRRRH